MAITVSPTITDPTHHLSLSDGTNTIGIVLRNTNNGNADAKAIQRTPLNRTGQKIVQGDTTYEDTELPYSSRAQDDWSGGRGLLDLEKDRRRFYDSYRCDTTRGEVILGPKETASRTENLTPIGVTTYDSTKGVAPVLPPFQWTNHIASKITIGASTVKVGSVQVRVTLPGNAEVWVRIYSDNNGQIATSFIGSGHVDVSTIGTPVDVVVPMSCSLNANTTYWVCVYAFYIPGIVDGTSYFAIDTNETGNVLNTYYAESTELASTTPNQALHFIIQPVGLGKGRFFEYKGCLYAVTAPDDFSTPQLFINGYRGLASSNAGVLGLLKTSLSVTANSLIGAIAVITAGPGSEEETPWRVITGNGVADIIVSPPWNVTHTTATEFAIIGTDVWTEITGHGLTKPITDVFVVDDVIYFAQGDATNIRRARFYNSSGTWTAEYADDGTNKATLLALQATETGARKVWKANATTSLVSCADPVAWGTNLTFKVSDTVTNITCGNPASRITGLAVYGDPAIPYILKEDSLGAICNGVYAEAPLGEMKSVRSVENGRAWMVKGVYLYFSFHQSLERYYSDDLTDMGPDRDEGLPAGRQGAIYHMTAYPGRLYVAIDGGEDGYSSILCENGGGSGGSWHEIYRGAIGRRIRRLFVQVIPGNTVDRLWFAEGADFKWIPIALNPRKQDGYTYQTGGYVISSWINCKFMDLTKLFKSLKLVTENLSTGHQTITLSYRLDNTETWTDLATLFTTSPSQEINLSNTFNITGKRIQFKLTLNTDDELVTPVINAMVLEAMIAETTKYAYAFSMLVGDNNHDLENEEDESQRAETILAILEGWATTPTALLMHSVYSPDDNKYVKLQPFSRRPFELNTEEQLETHLLPLTLVEV